MYLTSQRVVTNDGRTGINSFFHSHDSGTETQISNIKDIISIAESNTGDLIKSICDIRPGGNRVKSYLDVVAPNNIDEKSILSALDEFRSKVVQAQFAPVIYLIGKTGIRFNAEFGLYDMIISEYDVLMEKAVSLFRQVTNEKLVKQTLSSDNVKSTEKNVNVVKEIPAEGYNKQNHHG